MMLRSWPRCALGFALLASTLGADCTVGRQVVDEFGVGGMAPTCESVPCSAPRVDFTLPAFLDPAQCNVPGACADAPFEGVAPGTELHASTLRLSAEAPTDIAWDDVTMAGGSLLLSGPVTLRLRAGSMLDGVVVLFSAPEGAAGPRLVVEESQLRSVTVRDAGSVGVLELVRSLGDALDCEVGSLSVHGSTLEGVRLSIRDLELVDTQLTTSELSFDEAYLASVRADDLRTPHCGHVATALTSIGGDASEFGPCETLLFISSSMVYGQIDGPVHMEGSRLVSVLVGRRLPTQIDAFEGGIERARFCEFAGALRLASSLKVSCSSCEGVAALSACYVDSQPSLLSNPCTVLNHDLERCADPLPRAVDLH